MARWTKFYLIRIEFLGFRYCGWQIQPGVKTVEEMINKTFKYILKHEGFKILGCGRTDAKVSADDFAFELFLNEDIDMPTMLCDLNKNLPFDIRAKTIEKVDAKFNVIQNSKEKEYHYYFSYGDKSHPFNASHIINFNKELDEGAPHYEHSWFERYADFSVGTFIPVILLLVLINTIALKFFGAALIG